MISVMILATFIYLGFSCSKPMTKSFLIDLYCWLKRHDTGFTTSGWSTAYLIHLISNVYYEMLHYLEKDQDLNHCVSPEEQVVRINN